MANFTEEQIKEIKLAKEMGDAKGVEVISQHPEWSPLLMNFVWNRIKDDKYFDRLVEYANATGKDSSGLVGKSHLLMTFPVIEKMNSEATLDTIRVAIEVLNKNNNISENQLIWECIRECYLAKESTRRVKLTGYLADDFRVTKALLSEGDDTIGDLLDNIRYGASDVLGKTKEMESIFGGHLIPGFNICLGLDDMNIRGQQIKWGYEYCDESFDSFVLSVKSRDQKMVDYINQRSAEDGKNNQSLYAPKAVTSGASFTEGIGFDSPISCIINATDYDSYIENSVPIKRVDYGTREIRRTTTTKEALKILEALGFKVIYNETKLDLLGKEFGGFSDEETRCIIMHNPETGAIMHADSASATTFRYGGCNILVPYRDYGMSTLRYGVEQNVIEDINGVRSDNSLWVGRVTAEDNFIEEYKNFVSSVSLVKDTTVLGYNTWNGIPIPLTYDTIYPPRDHQYKHKSIEYLFIGGAGMSPHTLMSFANLLNVEEKIKLMPKDSQWVYKPFLDNKYKWILNSGYFTNSIQDNSIILGVLFNILNIPDSEIEKYYQTALGMFDRHIDKENCLKLLSSRSVKESFFGKSKEVADFLDEFGFTPAKYNRHTEIQKKKIMLKFDQSLSVIRKLLRGCNATGEWTLYEDRGITYLKGSTGRVVLGEGVIMVDGCCKGYTDNIWYKAISGTIDKLVKSIKKPLKEIRFGVDGRSSNIEISKSKTEAKSFDVILK